VPAYLEACPRLAAEAAGRGELERARVLLARASLVSALAVGCDAAPGEVGMLGGR